MWLEARMLVGFCPARGQRVRLRAHGRLQPRHGGAAFRMIPPFERVASLLLVSKWLRVVKTVLGSHFGIGGSTFPVRLRRMQVPMSGKAPCSLFAFPYLACSLVLACEVSFLSVVVLDLRSPRNFPAAATPQKKRKHNTNT